MRVVSGFARLRQRWGKMGSRGTGGGESKKKTMSWRRRRHKRDENYCGRVTVIIAPVWIDVAYMNEKGQKEGKEQKEKGFEGVKGVEGWKSLEKHHKLVLESSTSIIMNSEEKVLQRSPSSFQCLLYTYFAFGLTSSHPHLLFADNTSNVILPLLPCLLFTVVNLSKCLHFFPSVLHVFSNNTYNNIRSFFFIF